MRNVAPIAVLTLLAHPASAWACSVCFDTTAENRWAYMATTALLSFVPLIVLFGLFFYIRGKLITRWELERDEAIAALDSPSQAK